MFWILCSFISISLWLYWLYRENLKSHSYWKIRGVSQEETLPLLGNTAWSIFRTQSLTDRFQQIYNNFPGKRYSGIYQFLTPILIVRDPNLAKQILIKDFDHFSDHWTTVSEEDEPIWGRTLFALKGSKWRAMRTILSPSFTSSKMKLLFSSIAECADNFTEHFLNQNQAIIHVDMAKQTKKFSNDVIASTAFGIKCDSLKDKNNELFLTALEAFDFDSFWKNFKFSLILMAPGIAKFFKLSLFSKEVRMFFETLVEDTINMREKENIARPDVIHLLKEAKKSNMGNNEEAKDRLNDEPQNKFVLSNLDMTAQALIFYFGGLDSVSILLGLMSYELAVNVQVQEKLQLEIDQTYLECDGKLTYEALLKMKYLDMVVCEVLRKWAIAGVLDRICIKPYTILPVSPDEKPLHLQVGDYVWIPVIGIHRDPAYHPDPERFDPDRFTDERKNNMKSFTYFPFGDGPRNCIGSRLALLEAKVFFFSVLLKFNLLVNDKTQIPLRISKKHLVMHPDRGFCMGLQPRNVIK